MNINHANLSPFHGRPYTKQHIAEDGSLSFSIHPRELTPLRAKIADIAAPICSLWAGWQGLLAVPTISQSILMSEDYLYWVVIGLTLISFPLFKFIWRLLLKRRWHMVMTPEQFMVLTWRGWRVYDRQLAHKFSLLIHDKAQLEKERIEQQLRKGKTNGRTYSELNYYGDAFHISYEYLGQRNDIATVFIAKRATALVARLKACDDVMDAQGKMGDGTALRPDDQWGDEPGDIDE